MVLGLRNYREMMMMGKGRDCYRMLGIESVVLSLPFSTFQLTYISNKDQRWNYHHIW